MSRFIPLPSIEHPQVVDRYEQRYGDRLDFDPRPQVLDLRNPEHVAKLFGKSLPQGEEVVTIGDELFSTKELQSAHEENPQPKDHPFKPHHYNLQKDLDAIKAFYESRGK